MKVLAVTFISLSLLALVASQAQTSAAQADAPPPVSAQDSHSIKITQRGTQPSAEGSAEHFTGSVQVEPLFPVHDPSHVSGGRVTFEPGARTAMKDLHESYKTWSENSGLDPLTNACFGKELGRRGFEKIRGRTGDAWRGIALTQA